jgi:hypothetical protein
MSDRVIRVPESAQVVRSPGGTPATVRQTVDRVRVVTAGLPGPVGPGGPPGADGAVTVQHLATTPLGGHRIVYQSADGPAYADCAVLDHQDRVLGITTGAAAAGSLVSIQRSGELTEPTWNWQPGPVLLGHHGTLTQSPPLPPDGAFLLCLGFSVNPTTLYVAPREPITLLE